MAEAHQGGFIIGVKGGYKRSARAVSVLGDAPRQGHRIQGRRHHKFLACFESEPDLDRHPGKLVELLFEGKFLSKGCHGRLDAMPPSESFSQAGAE